MTRSLLPVLLLFGLSFASSADTLQPGQTLEDVAQQSTVQPNPSGEKAWRGRSLGDLQKRKLLRKSKAPAKATTKKLSPKSGSSNDSDRKTGEALLVKPSVGSRENASRPEENAPPSPEPETAAPLAPTANGEESEVLPSTAFEQGAEHFQKQNWDASVRHFRAVRERQPHKLLPWLLEISALIQLDRYEEAEQTAKKLSSTIPSASSLPVVKRLLVGH